MQQPQRIENHRLERESELFFEQLLPREWTSYKPMPDYGVDLIVDVFDENNATSRQLLVQLKASQKSDSTADRNFERINIDVTTYNYLWNQLQVVMLVKYVASEECAYWQLLSQIPEPNQQHNSMTIRIPRENILSDINWNQIRRYIEHVHTQKLSRRNRPSLNDFA